MQDNDSRTKRYRSTGSETFEQRRGSSPPFQEEERRPDYWVGELQAILQNQESPLRIPCLKKNGTEPGTQ
jgi:hypothetical protein